MRGVRSFQNPLARAEEKARQINRFGGIEAGKVAETSTGRPSLETGTDLLEDVGGATTRYFLSEWDLSDGEQEAG